MSHIVIVGGTGGLGQEIARRAQARGDRVVLTSRDAGRAAAAAAALGAGCRGVGVDLARPASIAGALADVADVDHLVLTAIEQGQNSLQKFDVEAATRALTVKLVGYAETVRALRPRFSPGASVVLFGGVAGERPYPGSTMVTTSNGGVASLVRTLAVEIAPHRVNALHPGVVGDSPRWSGVANHPAIPRTPIGRLVTMAEIADATEFLLRNTGINAHNLHVDGGVLAM